MLPVDATETDATDDAPRVWTNADLENLDPEWVRAVTLEIERERPLPADERGAVSPVGPAADTTARATVNPSTSLRPLARSSNARAPSARERSLAYARERVYRLHKILYGGQVNGGVNRRMPRLGTRDWEIRRELMEARAYLEALERPD